jgi:hypothetical protein
VNRITGLNIGQEETPIYFERMAKEARILAAESVTEPVRANWIRIAEQWEALARQANKLPQLSEG